MIAKAHRRRREREMKYSTILFGALLSLVLVPVSAGRSSAAPVAPDALAAAMRSTDLVVAAAQPTVVRRNVTTVNRNVTINRNVTVNRNVNVRRNVTVVRPGGARVVAPVRGVGVVSPVRGVGFVGPGRSWVVRPWVRRAYFGTVIGGVTLGTLIAVSAYGVAPPPPDPDLCWYWADPAQI